MMKRWLAFLLGLIPALVGAGGAYPCQWGLICTIPVEIYEPDGVDTAATADIAIPSADLELYCPGQPVQTSGELLVDETSPRGFAVVVPGTLTDCARFEVKIRDQDATATYLATSVHVATCGNASAAQVNCSGDLAPASTALVNTTWTDARAGNLDQLDASVASRSSHAPTDIVSSGPINTAGGAVSVVTVTGEATALGASAETSILNQTTAALANARLNQLLDAPLVSQPGPGSLFGDMTEDDPGSPGTQRYTAAALAEAPTGGASTVDLNPDQSTVTIGFVNTVNNPTTCGTVQDKADYNLAANQTGVTVGTCNNLVNMLPSALADMFNSDSGETYASAVPGSVVKEIADNAQTAALTVSQIVEGLGGIRTSIATVTDPTNFTLAAGSNISLAYQDEYTAVIGNQADSDNSACHRQITGYLGPSRTVTIGSACPSGFNIAAGDPVSILPNGAGAAIAVVTVNNGQVQVDQTQTLETGISVGCAQAAVLAVQTGEQEVTGGGTNYEYKSRDGLVTRVQATRSATGRSQATIICPPGL